MSLLCQKRAKNGKWRRHSLYCSPNIIRVIKSRRLRWSGDVARMEESRIAFKIIRGKPTGKSQKVILKLKFHHNLQERDF